MFVHTKEEIIIGPPRIGRWHALAEAIRIGCQMIGEQCFGDYYSDGDSACAIGAAAVGLGNIDPLLVKEPMVSSCPVRSNCELVHLPRGNDWALVPHLNDDHRWSREKIADYLDTL